MSVRTLGPRSVCQNCGRNADYCDMCGNEFVNGQAVCCKESPVAQHWCRTCMKPSRIKVSRGEKPR